MLCSIHRLDDELNITSAVGTDAQILCETEPLVAIVYEFSGGASSAEVTGLLPTCW